MPVFLPSRREAFRVMAFPAHPEKLHQVQHGGEKGRELPSSKVRSAASNTLTRNFPAVTFWVVVVQSCRLMDEDEDLQRFQLLNALVPATTKTTQ